MRTRFLEFAVRPHSRRECSLLVKSKHAVTFLAVKGLQYLIMDMRFPAAFLAETAVRYFKIQTHACPDASTSSHLDKR